ncbi:uncharacterized protein LOC119106418 isoform X1 [Pollicipes pollicipes]|uniref:uncharacterized protein LOC119106418 isoform X1 n=1 Tax=Pollicipes pollicipes TaxID=41117 RepID=UPI001884BAE9|nr:uncharacterized protein LOC119106418 isoform X1 [Pollicipes pollicipes]
MCDVSGCSSEVGSVSDDGRDAMLDILGEFQRLYQTRMERLERDPAAPSYSKDKMELLEDWIGDLNQQNRTLVETVKELETEASRRCEMLESRLVSTTSSTKQYMLQLHQLQRQVQQLMAGRLQAESRAGEMTSLVDRLTAENEQLRQQVELAGDGLGGQHSANRPPPQGVVSDERARPPAKTGEDVSDHLLRLKSDLRVALREKEDLQEILEIRKCELEESQAEVADLKSTLDRVRSAPAATPSTAGPRHKVEPPAEVHRLQRTLQGPCRPAESGPSRTSQGQGPPHGGHGGTGR